MSEQTSTTHDTLGFGKYRDKTIQEVYDTDMQYCRWLLQQEVFVNAKPYLKEFLNSKFKDNDGSFLITFGKHKGKTIKWIYVNDRKYFDWMYTSGFAKDKIPKLYTEMIELLM